MSRISWTLLGKNTGKPTGLEEVVALVGGGGALGDVVVARRWRSRRRASTVPAMLACLNTSMQRSTPGPLPYQMPKTPSNFAFSGNRSSCCVPQTAVAPSSSFTPGWNTMCCLARCFFAAIRAWSYASPAGSRGSREMKPAVLRPAMASRVRCSIGRRTSAWTPLMKARPSSGAYLSSSVTFSRARRMCSSRGRSCGESPDRWLTSGPRLWRGRVPWLPSRRVWRRAGSAENSVGNNARRVFASSAPAAVV